MIRRCLGAALLVVVSASALALSATGHAGDRIVRHPDQMQMVETYRTLQGFNHVIGDRRFVGYAEMTAGGCHLTILSAATHDERLAEGVTEVTFTLPAAGRYEIPVGTSSALAIACTADADAIKLVTLEASARGIAGL